MVYTPRQVAVRAREAAVLLLRALEHERLVAHFVDSYAVDYDRAVCTAYPRQYRETVEHIEREALLAMAAWVEHAIPKRLGIRSAPQAVPARRRPPSAKGASKRGPAAKPNRKAPLQPDLTESFRVEFLVALGQALEWEDAELDDFCRDLELYKKLEPAPSAGKCQRRKATSSPAGPFVDRCGVLLDPSMFDNARRAAAQFQGQLRITMEVVLKTVFSQRRAN